MSKKAAYESPEERPASRRDFLRVSALSAGALAAGSFVHLPFGYAKEELYPAKRIDFIVPNKAGGGYDIMARAIGPFMSKHLKGLSPGCTGGDIMVKNAETKGYTLLYNAKPDGYTIGAMDTSPIVDSIMGTTEVDFTKFVFLNLAVSTTKLIVAGKNGFGSWAEVVEAMKKEPVKMAVGFFARANHIAGIVVNEKLGTRFKLIPFRGTAESMGAVIRGDTQVGIVSQDSAKGLVDSKEVKVLLSFSEGPEYPGVPCVTELGFPAEIVDAVASHRFMIAPPELAAEPKKLLLAATKRSMEDPAFMDWAKKADFPLKRLYGADAEAFFRKFVAYYNGMAPVLKKYLN
jgi:tripartite-type tricarboxylate transporter receptor subunit TctC